MRSFEVVEEQGEQVPPVLATSLLSGWLRACPGTLQEIYTALGGSIPAGRSVLEWEDFDKRMGARLAEAFQRGELRAFPIPRLESVSVLPRSSERPGPPPPVGEETTAIVIELVSETAGPLGGQPYCVMLQDGTKREGRLGSDGCAKVEGLTPGTYTVTFPEAHPS